MPAKYDFGLLFNNNTRPNEFDQNAYINFLYQKSVKQLFFQKVIVFYINEQNQKQVAYTAFL